MEDSGIEDSGDHFETSTTKVNIRSDSSSPSSTGSLHLPLNERPQISKLTLAKQLQRKLEARIEHAKRLHNEYHASTNTNGLIPIQRLPIPGAKDHQPLVQWDSDSEEDIVDFFPVSKKDSRCHQEISDTFSIEEMSISEEEEDDLQLVPPKTIYKKFGCCPYRAKCSIL